MLQDLVPFVTHPFGGFVGERMIELLPYAPPQGGGEKFLSPMAEVLCRYKGRRCPEFCGFKPQNEGYRGLR